MLRGPESAVTVGWEGWFGRRALSRNWEQSMDRWARTRGVPNILRQPAEAEYSAVWPNILPKPNRGSLFAE